MHAYRCAALLLAAALVAPIGAQQTNDAEYTAKMIPGAKLSVYQGIGHSPFFEDPARFKPKSNGDNENSAIKQIAARAKAARMT